MRMTHEILLFASLRERLGRDRISVEVSTDNGATADVAALLDAISQQHPELREILPNVRVAVDHEFSSADTPIREGVEIALIPPVSGG